MNNHKITRHRVLQIIAGAIAGTVTSGFLPVQAATQPIAKSPLPILPSRLNKDFIIKHSIPPIPHGSGPHGTNSALFDRLSSDHFGRMFPNLPPYAPQADDLKRLAATMIEGLKPDGSAPVETDDPAAPSNNNLVPAGYTYFGQFIDHDLTYDPSAMSQAIQDVQGLRNLRTPRFDLDSVYGGGPQNSPFLYQNGGVKLLIGKNKSGEDDLPRNSEETDARALTGDPRNDENLIISQLHLAFLKYHNKVVDELGASSAIFETARRVVLLHYQWLVFRDFLPRIVGAQLADEVLRPGSPKFFRVGDQPFIPVEFSAGAYRFGHSMVRANYSLNALTAGDNPNGSPREIPIFDPVPQAGVAANDLRGFRRRPANRQIDWSHFFEFPGNTKNLQLSRAFDTQLSHGLGFLPYPVVTDPPPSLAERNLKRGVSLGLPSGQAVAREMGLPDVLIVSIDNKINRFQIGTGYQLSGHPEETVPKITTEEKTYLENTFGHETPLWYYILKEAELIGKGRALGPVGGRIVAEVFGGLLSADPFAFVHTNPPWRPTKGKFGCTREGEFTMVDLLNYIR